MSKESRRAELEEQYKKHLEEIEASEEEGDDDEDIIILRGNARKQFLKKLESSGFTLREAKETADEVEEEVELDADGNPVEKSEGEEVEEETDEKPPAKKKKEVVKDDPKPPANHRFFR